MKVAIGADHAGYGLKSYLTKYLKEKGVDVNDFGTDSEDSVDYPDFAHPVAENVEKGESDLGVVICGSANGVCMTANKHKGVRCALAWTPEIASLAKQHNNANVLALPARFIDDAVAIEIVDAFLTAAFEGGRHQRRVEKI